MFAWALLIPALTAVRSTHEVVIYATGYDGPIDNADSWRYFDFQRATTIVTLGGGVPSKLIARGRATGTAVVRGEVFDIDATNTTAVTSWIGDAVERSADADGLHVVAIRAQHEGRSRAVTAAFKQLRTALNDSAQLSVMLPLTPGADVDRAAIADIVDFVVLAAFDQNVGSLNPEPNIAIATLKAALKASAKLVEPMKTVVALPWWGYDYRCRSDDASGQAAACNSEPPRGTAAVWHGWNVQRSVAIINVIANRQQVAAPSLNSTTQEMTLRYADEVRSHS